MRRDSGWIRIPSSPKCYLLISSSLDFIYPVWLESCHGDTFHVVRKFAAKRKLMRKRRNEEMQKIYCIPAQDVHTKVPMSQLAYETLYEARQLI